MNFDRNTIIGFIVLAVLFVGYFFYTTKEQQAYQLAKHKQDSINALNQPKPDTAALRIDSLAADSIDRVAAAGGFQASANGSEQVTVVENDLLKIAFTNRGGQPKWVELKHFEGPDSTAVKLAASEFDKITYTINTAPNRTAHIPNFFFNGGQVIKGADGTQTVSYQLQSPQGQAVVHQFVIKPGQYMVDFNLQIAGVPQLLGGNSLNMTWQNQSLQLQRDLTYERQQSQIAYYVDGDYDYSGIMGGGSETFNDPVQWVGVKQQFFNTTLIAKQNNFTSGAVTWQSPESGNVVTRAVANLKMELPAATNATVPLALYYGPTDYKILKQYGNDMEDMVNLGSGIFAFVKYINRWIILPVFDLFAKLTSNYGIVILLLTVFIRLLISPLTYSSYLSGAKMKALRPEIDKLKEKFGTDQQAISMEQMKLFREAGVNPLGGCIPALLQIPIFFALYSFFNANVELRGEAFLWAQDLSQYDSILSWSGWEIPFYGNHISLFTITATLTSLLISVYSMSMTPDQNNPVLKYMPYVFPVFLLFIFNSQPAALTWYYTVSNLITLLLQFIIQNYIIDHDKVLAKIEANRKKPKTKSKWQERMEQMQEQQKKMQELQNKSKR